MRVGADELVDYARGNAGGRCDPVKSARPGPADVAEVETKQGQEPGVVGGLGHRGRVDVYGGQFSLQRERQPDQIESAWLTQPGVVGDPLGPP